MASYIVRLDDPHRQLIITFQAKYLGNFPIGSL